jgi:DMSO/TMAO reductase YedYZ molybdopterin-dependent catalytic subunit
MNENQIPRRRFLKIGGAILAAIPIVVVSGRADAATNASMRAALKYQSSPEGDKSCANCVQFAAPSGCNAMPGDTEISPQGYCSVWTKKG